MIPPDVENAVAAQEIEIGLIIHIVEICALRSCVDLVEADHPLSRHQRRVHVPLMEPIIFAKPRSDDFL